MLVYGYNHSFNYEVEFLASVLLSDNDRICDLRVRYNCNHNNKNKKNQLFFKYYGYPEDSSIYAVHSSKQIVKVTSTYAYSNELLDWYVLFFGNWSCADQRSDVSTITPVKRSFGPTMLTVANTVLIPIGQNRLYTQLVQLGLRFTRGVILETSPTGFARSFVSLFLLRLSDYLQSISTETALT